jgi:6-phosphogluconolactonase
MKGRLEIADSLFALQQRAADVFVERVTDEIHSHGMASVALAGGTTPRGVYELLGSPQYRDRVEWKRVHLFWGDERCVGPTAPESNFRMANESLIRNVAIPPGNIHRIRGEMKPQDAARESETEILRFFTLKAGGFPKFSLVLLGLGEDGHTASLFPGTTVLEERDHIVMDVYVERLASSRITMTIPAINNAASIVFVVSGTTKASILSEVLKDGQPRFPAQYIVPSSGQLYWLVDKAAASQIPTEEAS